MKQNFLNLPKQPMRFAPRMTSKRLGLRNYTNVAYKEDAPDEAALLEKVKTAAKTKVDEELQARSYQNSEQVNAIITKVFEGMPLDALRKYTEDKDTLNENIRNIAAEVEKINKRSVHVAESRTNAIMEAMEGKLPNEQITGWDKVRDAMKAGNTRGKNEVIHLNVRAAATMALGNTIDETTFTVPVTIVESMSMGEFVPKRRGEQFIYNIADRTIVQNITQYKTWLEEGTEQGTFAIVAEGAIKPLVSTGLVRNYAVAKKIAGKYVITEEFMKFRQDAYNIIRRIINDKMLRDFAAILVVDLNAQAVGYTGTTLDATFAAPNDYDAIGAVAAQIETLNFVPDILILHPQDKWRLALEKDTQGRYYMMIPMINPDGTTTMMGFRVVVSTYQTPGYFTLGESALFKIEEEPITIRMGYGIDTTSATVSGTSVITAVISDFDSNKMRMIVETYFLDYLPTPYIGSYVRAQFSTVKTALHT